MIRLFIALPLSEPARDQLATVIESLRALGGRLKWVPAKNMHLTVKFLGDTDPNLVSEISSEIDKVASDNKAIESKIIGIGGFPNLSHPRVIWTGIHGERERFTKIAEEIDKAISEFGFEKERRPFKAHLTLARVRDPKDVEPLTEKLRTFQFEPIEQCFDKLVLYKSTLTPRGPIYEQLHVARLL